MRRDLGGAEIGRCRDRTRQIRVRPRDGGWQGRRQRTSLACRRNEDTGSEASLCLGGICIGPADRRPLAAGSRGPWIRVPCGAKANAQEIAEATIHQCLGVEASVLKASLVL